MDVSKAVVKLVLETSHWMMLHSWVDQLKLIEILTENNQHYATQDIIKLLKISKSIKLLVKMKNVSFILQKKLNGLFGQPNKSLIVE